MKELALLQESLPRLIGGKENSFKTIDDEKLIKIENSLIESSRAMNSFSRRNTQTDIKLRTLTMLSVNSPYRTLRQILAQVEKKRSAVQENYFKMAKQKARMNILKQKDDELSKIKVK